MMAPKITSKFSRGLELTSWASRLKAFAQKCCSVYRINDVAADDGMSTLSMSHEDPNPGISAVALRKLQDNVIRVRERTRRADACVTMRLKSSHRPAWCNKDCSRICDMEQHTSECRDFVIRRIDRAVQSWVVEHDDLGMKLCRST